LAGARAEALARGLVAHLRATLAAPALDLAEPPAVLRGGFDTEIFALRLRGGPPAFAGPLVLRVLRAHHDPAMALREQATQNALAGLGFPAPRVLLAAADPAPLGAPFVLMERRPGRSLLETRAIGMGGVLADLQLRLHALDAAPLARALGPAGSFDGYLDMFERRIARGGLDGLAPLVGWLRAHRPPGDAPVICHGDFHPQNILVEDGRVSGVLDWPNALVAEPAFDVASTLNILRFVPAGLTAMPPVFRWLAGLAQPLLARRYLAVYRRRRAIDDARLAYHSVAAALRALVRAGETRRRAAGGPPSELDASPYATRLLEHVRGVTGVTATP
jgi:aminoglycoside phosphotransferase (APT) family kinase protein